MPKLPGVNHLDAVRALEKAGFQIARQGKHSVMTDGARVLSIPRHNPVNAITMGNIVCDAGLTNDAFADSSEKAGLNEALKGIIAPLRQPA
jgi:predicted RNA binding protein YcfA (HicA-like mRNA interferase family)